MPSMTRFAARSVLVTGSANGIGRAIAARFASEGAAVLVVDVDDGPAMAAAIDKWVGLVGRLDIVVNNAVAFDAANPDDGDVVSTPIEVWDRTYAVNVRGPMMTCKHAIPIMIESGGGVIVNVSSTSAARGDVNYAAYSSSKASLHALTRSIAVSHSQRGIRANTVASGFIMTEAARRNVGPAKLDILNRSRLVPEPGTPEDVAALVAFLASPDARYITGQTYSIEGGATVNQPWYWGGADGHPPAYISDGYAGATTPRW